MEKKEFADTAFDPEHELFIVYVVAVNVNLDNEVYYSKRVQIGYLKADEVFVKVSSKYADFTDVVSLKLTI